ncbi:MAG: GNAT family N-acetyltransferase [Pyrinomonadaceae bacterium]
MNVIETERLQLRKLTADDAAFMLELLNEPSFLRFIGDRGVRTIEDARRYILQGPVASYEQHGYGLWLVELKAAHVPIGLCGLVKRETLPDADIGYAFLPRYWSQGYAYESAAAVMNYATNVLGLKRLLAITDQDNVASIKVLAKIGLKFDRLIRLTDEAPEIKLFATDS